MSIFIQCCCHCRNEM